MRYPYLFDAMALDYIYHLPVAETYVTIAILNQDDLPLKEITGYVTGGSISVSSSSLIRRTGSLSLVTNPYETEAIMLHEVTNINNLISLNKRVAVEVGIKNIGGQYLDTDIFWFPLGVYTITNPSVTHDASGIKISLKLNDKMSLLNGTEGGTIPIATILSPYEDRMPQHIISTPVMNADGTWSETSSYPLVQTPIADLIPDLITTYSSIPQSQIVIDNIPRRIRNKMYWGGSVERDPQRLYDVLYLYTITQGSQTTWYASLYGAPAAAKECYVFDVNDTIGYCYTDLVYPEQLASNNKDNVAAILSKIRDKIGNYEFYFDVDGIFHFREIRNNLNQGSAEADILSALDDKYLSNMMNEHQGIAYDLTNSHYISSYVNNPNYLKVKNDITVWASGTSDKLPRRYHLIIDIPEPFHAYEYTTYQDESGVIRARDVSISTSGFQPLDIRMNMYLYYLYCYEKEQEDGVKSGVGHSKLAQELIDFWPTIYDVRPGANTFLSEDYETFNYYFDMIDATQAIAHQDLAQLAIKNIGQRDIVLEDKYSNCLFATSTELNINFVKDEGEYYLFHRGNTSSSTPLQFVLTQRQQDIGNSEAVQILYEEVHNGECVYTTTYSLTGSVLKQNNEYLITTPTAFFTSPISMVFTNDESAGRIVCSLNDTTDAQVLQRTLGEQDIIRIIITFPNRNQTAKNECTTYAHPYIVVAPDIYDHLKLGYKLTPASEYVRSVLHEYIGYNNSITLTSIPLYHLDVNSRISVEDDASDIHGDYIIQSLTIPLDLSGKMTINATKAVERI